MMPSRVIELLAGWWNWFGKRSSVVFDMALVVGAKLPHGSQ